MLGANLDGRVLTRRAGAIAGAEVLLTEAGRFGFTDSGGRFSLRGLPSGSFQVRLSADGFVSDSVRLELVKGRIDTLVYYLNGRPFFTDYGITGHVWGRGWPPEPLVFFRLKASVDDPDGLSDIDSVWCEVPEVGLNRRLPFDPDAGRFVLTLRDDALPERNPETLVGRDVYFRVVDIEAAVTDAPPCRLARLVRELPVPVFPSGGMDTLSQDTVFTWRALRPGYAVNYRGEVVRIEGGGPAGVVLEFARPGKLDTTWQLPYAGLEAGDYYWTVEAFDEFGNSARSAEERFHVR